MKSHLKTNYQAQSLFKINKKILEWDLIPLEGKGLVARFTGSDAYAHLELTIQKSEIDYSSEVYWNVNEHQIPYNFGHKPFIEETLAFFTNYVSGIKGERILLKYEITNIGFHIVDSQPKHFAEATMKALINSFDETIFPFNDERAKKVSSQTFDYIQKNKIGFLRSEIIESLKQQEISQILSKIFDKENVDLRMLNGVFFNTYISNSFQNRKVLLQNSDIDELKKCNAVDEYDKITDIGKAHVAKILNDQYDLNYHFNIKLEDFQ